MGRAGFLSFLIWVPFLLSAQEVKIDGYFMADSAKLGERVGYVLKANYPSERQLIFPDSTYDFSPFVLLEKQTFRSSTQDSITADSTIYYLSNFELDSVVYLTLPVYELDRYDSITHFPLEAALAVKWTLDSIPEQLLFEETTSYQPIPKKWNWILISLIAGLILLGLGLIYWVFGKRISQYLWERREKRKWKNFEIEWTASLSRLEKESSIGAADELLGLWKGYLEHLTALPFREWTTHELEASLGDLKLADSLRRIELIIYAGKKSEIQESTDYMKLVARKNYEDKLKNDKND